MRAFIKADVLIGANIHDNITDADHLIEAREIVGGSIYRNRQVRRAQEVLRNTIRRDLLVGVSVDALSMALAAAVTAAATMVA